MFASPTATAAVGDEGVAKPVNLATVQRLMAAWSALSSHYTEASVAAVSSPSTLPLSSSTIALLPALAPSLHDLRQHNGGRQAELFVDWFFASVLHSCIPLHVVAPLYSAIEQRPNGGKDAMEDDVEEEDAADSGDSDDALSAVPTEWLLSSFTSSLLLLCSRLQGLHALTLTLAEVSAASRPSSLSTRFHSLFHCLFASHKPLSSVFPTLLRAFFSHHLRTFQRLRSPDPTDVPSPSDEASHGQFVDLCQRLHSVQLLSPSSPVSSSLLSSLLLPVLRRHIAETCKDHTESHLSALLAFTSEVVVPFASLLLPSPTSPSPQSASLLLSTAQLYCLHLISRLFDLVIAYPASTPLLSDLHTVLPLTSLHPALLSSLTASLHRRLLHPGASTPDLLHTLIALTRSLRLVDDTGVLASPPLQLVSDYVRARPDCIRCVLRMLVGSGDGREGGEEAGDGEVDLSEELEAEPQRDYGDDSDSEAPKPAPTPAVPQGPGGPVHPFSAQPPGAAAPQPLSAVEGWTPDPLSAHPYVTSRKGRHADLLTILFALTPPGTPLHSFTLFLDEYRRMLALRLIGRAGYGRDEEVVRNERMKGWVGDDEMATCEVMVRDIENSRRVLTRLAKEAQDTLPPSLLRLVAVGGRGRVDREAVAEMVRGMDEWTVFVLSHEYWPLELLEPSLALTAVRPPAPLLGLQGLAGATYHRLFEPRTLTFLPLLGSCDVEVELHDRTVRLQCDPLALAVLQAFEGDGVTLAVEAVAAALGLSGDDEAQVEAVSRKLAFWCTHNVLREVKDSASSQAVYQVIEELSSEDVYDGEEEEEAEARDGAQQGEGGVDQYVLSLLTTFGELSCDRLHVYLKRFGVTAEFVYSWQEMQLQDHLQAMEQRGQLTQKDGIYRKR